VTVPTREIGKFARRGNLHVCLRRRARGQGCTKPSSGRGHRHKTVQKMEASPPLEGAGEPTHGSLSDVKVIVNLWDPIGKGKSSPISRGRKKRTECTPGIDINQKGGPIG